MADLVFNHYFWLSVIGVCLICMFAVSRYDNFQRKRKRKRWYTEEDVKRSFETGRNTSWTFEEYVEKNSK